MAKVKKNITISAPVEKVYDYLANQKNQPYWIPSMVEVRNSTGSGVGEQFQWTYKMAGILLEGETTVTELTQNKRIRSQSKGAVTSEWILNLEPQDGGTMLELNIDYTVPIPVLGKLAEKIVLNRNEREADLAMNNIKEIIED